jgi:hypothetical protein
MNFKLVDCELPEYGDKPKHVADKVKYMLEKKSEFFLVLRESNYLQASWLWL